MITKVSTVCIFVNDQDAAKAFYTEKLGFEVHLDVPMGPDSRWVAVAPKGAETEVILYKPDQNWEHYRQVVGKSQAVTFEVKDLDAFIAELKGKGVKIMVAPTREGWGYHAIILDHENNALLLVEEPKQEQQ